MKRFAELLTVVLAFVALSALPAFDTYGAGEEPATQGWFTYQVLHGAGKTVKAGLVRHEGIEYPDSLFIPSVVRIDGEDYEVTTLAKEKFYGEHGRPSYLHVPSSVRYVEEYAFYCSEIMEVDFEGVLDSIGPYAFSCSLIESFDFSKLPMNPEKIGYRGFYCAHLRELNWPSTHPVITEGMFRGSHLQKVLFPTSLRKIDCGAFIYTHIDTVHIPPNVEVGEEAFCCLDEIRELKLGEGCTIGKWAFSPRMNIKQLVLPRGTKLLERAFACVQALRVVDMPDDIDLTEAAGAFSRTGELWWYGLESWDWFHPWIETVIYRTSEPPFLWLMEEPFDSYTYEHATLYVEPGGVEAAKTTYPWLQFRTILPIPPEWGAVESPEGDGEGGGEVEILDLSGLRVGSETGGLPPGLYIERRGTRTRKIRIR